MKKLAGITCMVTAVLLMAGPAQAMLQNVDMDITVDTTEEAWVEVWLGGSEGAVGNTLGFWDNVNDPYLWSGLGLTLADVALNASESTADTTVYETLYEGGTTHLSDSLWGGSGVMEGASVDAMVKSYHNADGSYGPSEVHVWGDFSSGAYSVDITALAHIWGVRDSIFVTGEQEAYGTLENVHLSILQKTTQVPDGGASLALLGLALTGVATLRRKLAA